MKMVCGAHPHDCDGGHGPPLAPDLVANVAQGDHADDDSCDLDVVWHLRRGCREGGSAHRPHAGRAADYHAHHV